MHIWLIQIGEPLPLGNRTRLMRTGLLAEQFLARGHTVLWWASAFEHHRPRHDRVDLLPKPRRLGASSTDRGSPRQLSPRSSSAPGSPWRGPGTSHPAGTCSREVAASGRHQSEDGAAALSRGADRREGRLPAGRRESGVPGAESAGLRGGGGRVEVSDIASSQYPAAGEAITRPLPTQPLGVERVRDLCERRLTGTPGVDIFHIRVIIHTNAKYNELHPV